MSDDLVQRLRVESDNFMVPMSAMSAMSLAADEIERLRAEVAGAGRRYADSESRLAACDAALQDVQAERDALRERIEKAPSIELSREDWLDHYERVSPSYIGKRVALVVLDG